MLDTSVPSSTPTLEPLKLLRQKLNIASRDVQNFTDLAMHILPHEPADITLILLEYLNE
jgi:hypothetical protein